ncbi:hypothetical protein FUAX_44360 (plasmid) [Fulvitalea axinellae]|uniref:Uncharacterized protein n=1 Tax=Fulvitalea axinellae TaxID=1182444 RepID=A0AAU9DBZ4_9BACT|nr:hypothetical protein FUAX_44360 [Fulvitalea axinellae]
MIIGNKKRDRTTPISFLILLIPNNSIIIPISKNYQSLLIDK